jgi:hypothetical protein
MNAKQIILGLVLLDFTGLTAYAVYSYGFAGFFEAVTANVATICAFADLVIALSLIVAWMWQDARDRGWSPMPYVLLTLGLGSVGPLVYLIRREANEPAAETALSAHPARG